MNKNIFVNIVLNRNSHTNILINKGIHYWELFWKKNFDEYGLTKIPNFDSSNNILPANLKKIPDFDSSDLYVVTPITCKEIYQAIN